MELITKQELFERFILHRDIWGHASKLKTNKEQQEYLILCEKTGYMKRLNELERKASATRMALGVIPH
jgi:hypothetical protein